MSRASCGALILAESTTGEYKAKKRRRIYFRRILTNALSSRPGRAELQRLKPCLRSQPSIHDGFLHLGAFGEGASPVVDCAHGHQKENQEEVIEEEGKPQKKLPKKKQPKKKATAKNAAVRTPAARKPAPALLRQKAQWEPKHRHPGISAGRIRSAHQRRWRFTGIVRLRRSRFRERG